MPEESPLPGIGTLVNVATVLVGALLGLVLGNRLPQRTRELVTDALGLVTLLIAAVSAIEVLSPALSAAVGRSAPMLIVLGSLLIGGIVGPLLPLESPGGGLGGWLPYPLPGGSGSGGGHPCTAGFRPAPPALFP